MIETIRLFIRPFEECDRDKLISHLQDVSFMEYSKAGALDFNRANARFDQILLNSKNGRGKSALILKESARLIGYCGIEPFTLSGRVELELGYRLVPGCRGFGLATEAALAVSSKHRGKLFAYVDSGNLASSRVLSKVGFLYKGVCEIRGKEYALYQKNC